MADGTAPFMLDLAAAFGACPLKERSFFHFLYMTGGRQMIPDGLGYRIGAGKDLVCTEAGMGMAGNVQELLDDLFRLNAAPPGKGDHPADGLALRSGTAARFAHGCKQLEQPLFIFIDGNVQRPATGLHPVCPAFEG